MILTILERRDGAGQRWSATHGWDKAARLCLDRRTHASALNVIAMIDGQDRSLPPLAVMTPRSGWWHCAGERGGGLACWLEVVRALRDSGSERDVLFLASSGHELGHLGLEAFLEWRPGLAESAVVWLHLGASIGAAQEARSVLLASDDRLEHLALAEMARKGVDPAPTGLVGTRPAGEAMNIHQRGGRYISLVGGDALFHLEADRWPEAADVASVASYADAFAQLAIGLTRRAAGTPDGSRKLAT